MEPLSIRPRRLRASAPLRQMVRETHLAPHNFIDPLFVVPGGGEASETLIAVALAGGAVGAKLAGAGGGTILSLTHDLARTERALLDAGADQILRPVSAPGLTVTVEGQSSCAPKE